MLHLMYKLFPSWTIIGEKGEGGEGMREIVSVSLGSSQRDHEVILPVLGKQYRIRRIGTDGDMKKAVALIKELDGRVAAFGMGGIDRYLYGGNRVYEIRDSLQMVKAARISPIVDGSGLKNTLERDVILQLQQGGIVDFREKRVLIPSALDRFGMAEAIASQGADLILGDLIFALGLPIPFRSMEGLRRAARVIAPIACRLPFSLLYPIGKKQESNGKKHEDYFAMAEIIAGDFLYLKRYLPHTLENKIIITNTVTEGDLQLLRERKATLLVTTTPDMEGRSFGTNVIEALMVAIIQEQGKTLNQETYREMIQALGLKPRIINLNKENASIIQSPSSLF